jgi:hypothetical protein
LKTVSFLQVLKLNFSYSFRMLPCWGNEDTKHILLIFLETKKWRMQFINKKWLYINEELAYKKIVNCTNKAHIIHLGEYLDKVKQNWESRVRKE